VATVPQIVGIAAVVIIPIALLIMLFVYLRRTAPGGVIATPTEAKPVLTEPIMEGPAMRVAGARKCKKCGMAVTGTAVGGMMMRCPNCNTALPT